MSRVIAVSNQKGGVGKTTTSVNLAASLTLKGKKVLLIDSDPQANATMASGINKFKLARPNTLYGLLIEKMQVNDVITKETKGGYHLIPATEDLTAAEVRMLDFYARESCLAKAIEPVVDRYDYVIIDCPPALSLLTVNAMCASRYVLVPMQCEYFALEGLTQLIDIISQISQAINPNLKILGILRTMFDNRNRLSNDVSNELIKNFGDVIFETIIPRNVRLAEAPSYGMPVQFYDKSSVGSKAYMALAEELLSKEDKIWQA